jgi:hypothetical protein
MSNLTSVTVTSGVPTAGTGTVSTIDALMADGGQATLGNKADAKSTATDTTAISVVSVLKQISASVQTPPSTAVTNAGTFAVQAAGTVADGADATQGVTTGAAVITDATGTIQQYLRGLIKQFAAGAYSLKVWDGTNTAAVKPASTAPSATDPAFVVAISPNSVNANGRAADASSAPVALSNEDVTLLTTIGTNTAAAIPAGTAVMGKVGIDQTSDGTTNAVRLLAETTKVVGTVNISASQTVGIAAGSAAIGSVTNSYLTQFGTGFYVTVAASQSAASIKSSTGAVGDYLEGVLVIPATTAPGVVTVLDGTSGPTTVVAYPGGGTTALLTLTPFFIPLGAVSRVAGGWYITTGANVSVVAVGKFS